MVEPDYEQSYDHQMDGGDEEDWGNDGWDEGDAEDCNEELTMQRISSTGMGG